MTLIVKSGSKLDNQKIFEKELMPHTAALLTFAYHLTLNEADAEDLVQDTYAKAWKSIEKYQPGTNAKAWLFMIARNTFINEYRKKKKGPVITEIDERVLMQDKEDGAPSGYSDLKAEMFENMMGDEVTNAINALHEDFRLVILLCDVEEFSYEEIAGIIKAPIGTVRSRLHRARNQLKKQLRDYYESLGY